jgi:hypothetical protein
MRAKVSTPWSMPTGGKSSPKRKAKLAKTAQAADASRFSICFPMTLPSSEVGSIAASHGDGPRTREASSILLRWPRGLNPLPFEPTVGRRRVPRKQEEEIP